MTPKDWLDVGIRVVGVYSLWCAISYFAESALMYTDYIRNPDINFRYYMIYGWLDSFIGLILLRAPWILSNFAFPPAGDKEEQSVDDAANESKRG